MHAVKFRVDSMMETDLFGAANTVVVQVMT